MLHRQLGHDRGRGGAAGRRGLNGNWLFFLALAGAGAFILYLVGEPLVRARRHARLRRRALPDKWRAILGRALPWYDVLPDELRNRLEGMVQVFVDEAVYVGCRGQVIDDRVRLTVAAWACLMVLERPGELTGRGLTILVYPTGFLVDKEFEDEAGVVTEERQELSGESWEEGRVILSWDDIEAATSEPGAGENVIVHEFAHQLDQQAGGASGAPALGSAEEYRRWTSVLSQEYQKLRARGERHHGVLDPYGATDPVEFFAVASEAFFDAAPRLRADHPNLYSALASYYRLDPAAWIGEPAPVLESGARKVRGLPPVRRPGKR